MMPAAKHFDPVTGVDIHIILVPTPGGPVPTPIPHPFVGFIFDAMEYIPISIPLPVPFVGVVPIPLNASVKVNGVYRAMAGTMGRTVPGVHFPIGGTFAPPPPSNECEMFMGSATVQWDGDAASYMALPTLDCQSVGMPPFPRLNAKKKSKVKSMVLPTGVVLPIPAGPPVLIGGPPTISLMALAFKAGFAAAGKMAGYAMRKIKGSALARRVGAAAKKARQKVFKNVKPGFVKCKILKAEPVDITTGQVVVEQQDFFIPGRIPLEWIRHYGSQSERVGVCGCGWETPADVRLVMEKEGIVVFYDGTSSPTFFPSLPDGEPVMEEADGATLHRAQGRYEVRLKTGLTYCFPFHGHSTAEIMVDSVHDACGNWVRYVRDSSGLKEITESCGRRIEVHSERGLVRRMRLWHPEQQEPCPLARFDYSPDCDLLVVYDALDQPYRFLYRAHRLVRQSDRNGLSFAYEYDQYTSNGRCVHAWGDGRLYDYRFNFDAAVNLVRITDSLGHITAVWLDERMLPVSEVDPLGGITQFEYDQAGRTSVVVDPSGHRTEYEYDDRGNLIKLTRPDGNCVATEFDDANHAVKITDANGAVWQQEWDARGLLVRQVSPLGAESRYEYDSSGQLIGFVNANSARTALRFDSIGNLTRLTDAMGHATEFAYDELGNVTARIDPLGHQSRYRYDRKGRLADVRLPSGATIRCAYDAEDNLSFYVDENGAETRLEYFGLGEIKRRIQPDGHAVEYQYDTEERLIGVTNQRGETYILKRDAVGRIVEEVDYWGQARQYAYDASGYLMSSIDPLGHTVRYATDPLGRILNKTSANRIVEEFAYDANGNLVEAKNAYGSIKREFDAEGRLIKEAQGAFTIKNTYDANGNRVARETSLGNTIAYEFDGLDQAVSIRINKAEPMHIERDAAGRIAQERLSSHLSRRFRYNANGYLTEQAVSSNGSPLFATRFEYDPAGNLTERSDNQNGADIYRYDPLGRIIEHLDPQRRITNYLNDPAGDRLRTRIVESARQHVASEGQVQNHWRREGEYDGTYYRFDRAGNLVERRDRKRDLHLTWDASQRLIESQSSGTVTCYGYDPLGRRVFKETRGRRTLFYWDSDTLVGESVVLCNQPVTANDDDVVAGAEQSKDGKAVTQKETREYVYYPETFEPLASVEDAGTAQRVYHYHNDPNGCPTRLTDDRGAVRWSASYTAWGHISELHDSTVENPIRLQGQYEDEETGLTSSRYRYFDSKSGNFLSSDPIGLAGGLLPHQYAPNAVGWIDPLGLACGPAVRQNSRGQWIDSRGRFARAPDVSNLPSLKGRSVGQVEDIVRSRGYTRTNPANPRNQRWVHPDGSEVQIHAYGNAMTGPYKASNNAHAHKSLGRHGQAGTTELADDGMTAVTTHSAEAHIGMRNPADFPTVAGRPHGA